MKLLINTTDCIPLLNMVKVKGFLLFVVDILLVYFGMMTLFS